MEEPRAHSRRRTSSDLGPGWTVVGISVGLLFIVQASLNIGLRLYATSNTNTTNEIAEKEDLGKSLNMCQRSLWDKTRELEEKIFSLETTRHQLMAERDRQKQRPEGVVPYVYDGGWMSSGGSMYLGSTIQRNWSESRRICQELEADLAIITSVLEKNFISRIFREPRWIGLSDLQEEGVWRWVDGTLLTESSWMDDKPNNKGSAEDCVEINNLGQLGLWNDRKCSSERLFICEKRIKDL